MIKIQYWKNTKPFLVITADEKCQIENIFLKQWLAKATKGSDLLYWPTYCGIGYHWNNCIDTFRLFEFLNSMHLTVFKQKHFNYISVSIFHAIYPLFQGNESKRKSFHIIDVLEKSN